MLCRQACASTSIINYSPELLEQSGMQQHASSILYSSGIGLGKVWPLGLVAPDEPATPACGPSGAVRNSGVTLRLALLCCASLPWPCLGIACDH